MRGLRGLRGLIREVLDGLEIEGAERPQAFAERRFSGKLNLMLGSDMHQRVALAAAEAGLNITSYLVRLGWPTAQR